MVGRFAEWAVDTIRGEVVTMAKKNADTKGKQFGFWFYTGDWLKDPELRFCSIFARGLLVDLLCFMFESKERGYLVWPDGSPRTNEEIADAVSGGDRLEKLEAIAELERKGVLSRDSRGVLFSRRMARLGEISQTRSEAGSKGGSKTQAKAKQTGEQTGSNRGGVSDSDSVSDSDINLSLCADDPNGLIGRDVICPDWMREWFIRWLDWRWQDSGKKPPATLQQTWIMELNGRGQEKALVDLQFSISKQAKNLLRSENDLDRVTKARIDNATRPTGKETGAEAFKRIFGGQ